MFNRFRNSIVRSLRSNIEHIANKQWYNSPFGEKPLAPKSEYLNLAAKASSKSYPEIDSFEDELGFSIDKDWLDELPLHTQVVVKSSELCSEI